MRIEKGAVQMDPDTFAPVLPVTIYLPLDAIQDMVVQLPKSAESELAKIIGIEVVNMLKGQR